MAERFEPLALNDNQARHLLGVLAHVEDLLGSIEAAASASRSPFSKTLADIAPDEARLLGSFVAVARQRMLDACDRLGVPRPTPSVSARWSVETALDFAEISFSDLEPQTMSGYGSLPARTAEELAGVAKALQKLMRRGIALLRASNGVDLARRAELVEGRLGEALRRLERVISSRDLVVVRPLLAAAIDRALSDTLDVGIFGRVSSGKSSLIRSLLRTEVLPVGATPVTAVPLLLAHGPARVEVHTNDGTVDAEVAQLAEYATEERNPDNEKGVTLLAVFLPEVPDRVRFLDTPGVGSLSTSGPAQAFATLPRCDLGIVLVSAGSAVGPDDAALVSGLRRAGIPCEVLLSKADLLGETERGRALAYVSSEMRRVLGPSDGVDVRPVSTRPGFETTITALREDVLEPATSARLRSTREMLERRVRSLIVATEAALGGRSDDLARDARAERARDRARRRIRGIAEALVAAVPNTIEATADAVAVAWAAGRDGRDPAIDALRTPAAKALQAVRTAVEALGDELGADERELRVPPLFDPAWMNAVPGLPPPALGRRIAGRMLAMHRLAAVEPALRDSFTRLAARLSAWGEGAVERVHAASSAAPPSAAHDVELARIQVLLDGDPACSDGDPLSARTRVGAE